MWRTKKPIRSQRIFRSRGSSVFGQGLLILKYCLSPSLHLQELKQARQTAATEKHCSTLSKTRRRTHDKDLAAGGSAIKKSTPYGVLFLRAIDGARTRGLDLGKVARYQLRHYRICLRLFQKTNDILSKLSSLVKCFFNPWHIPFQDRY